MFKEALIVGLVLMFTKFFDWYGNTMFQRPIFCVSILGALLGHPVEGIMLAAELELVFLGNVSLGGVMPSDFTMGSLFGAAFALLLGKDVATAITLALPLAALGTLLYSCMKVAVTSLVPRFEKTIRDKNISAFKRLWVLQFCCFELCYFLLGFICILVGTEAVKAFIEMLPAWVQASMTVASTSGLSARTCSSHFCKFTRLVGRASTIPIILSQSWGIIMEMMPNTTRIHMTTLTMVAAKLPRALRLSGLVITLDDAFSTTCRTQLYTGASR